MLHGCKAVICRLSTAPTTASSSPGSAATTPRSSDKKRKTVDTTSDLWIVLPNGQAPRDHVPKHTRIAVPMFWGDYHAKKAGTPRLGENLLMAFSMPLLRVIVTRWFMMIMLNQTLT